jgi:hypothetical protein
MRRGKFDARAEIIREELTKCGKGSRIPHCEWGDRAITTLKKWTSDTMTRLCGQQNSTSKTRFKSNRH